MQHKNVPETPTRLGGAITLFVGASAFVAALVVVFSSWVMSITHNSEPSPAVAETLLREVGLCPDALASANVSQAQTTALVTDALEHLETHEGTIAAARADAMADAAAYRAAAQKVRSGTSTQQDQEALPGLQSAMNASQAALAGVLDGLFDAATDGVTGDPLAQLVNIRAASGRGVAVPYKVVTREDADWVALHRALRAKAVADRLGEDLEEPYASLLSTADSNGTVSLAQSRLATNGDAIASAYANALAPE